MYKIVKILVDEVEDISNGGVWRDFAESICKNKRKV